MAKPKLTRWFPPSVKPARTGVYLTRKDGFRHDGVLRSWNGECWSVIDDYEEPAPYLGPRQWRGLAENPNA